MRKLRIAQLARPWIPVPPTMYGGTERVVSWITEELVRRGHDVTLFAAGNSVTSAKLDAVIPRSLYPEFPWTETYLPLLNVSHCMARAADFDVIHAHDLLGLFFDDLVTTPVLYTLHQPINELKPGQRAAFERFRGQRFVSISDAQRRFPLNFVATVYHGMPIRDVPFNETGGDDLLMVGRITPVKGFPIGIEAARRAGMRLRIAAKVDPADQEYYETEVKPLMDGPRVDYVGELGGADLFRCYGDARAVLFPIDWEEPFGLVLIEAMAAGTPVIAFRRGSVPEIMVDGVTGFIVDTLEEMVEAIGKIGRIDRRACRRHVEEHFTVEKMVDDYERVYESILAGKS